MVLGSVGSSTTCITYELCDLEKDVQFPFVSKLSHLQNDGLGDVQNLLILTFDITFKSIESQ